MGTIAEHSAASRQEVTFYSGGERVAAWYFAPQGRRPAAGWPGLAICAGFTGTKEGADHGFLPGLLGGGYAGLVFDYRGWGESEGPRGMLDPMRQVEDVRSALAYLETREDVDAERLGLFGLSFGGGIAGYVAAVDERVKAAVSVLGVCDGRAWLRSQRRAYEWLEFLDAVDADRRERALGGQGRMVDPTEELMVATPERRALRGSGSEVRSPLASADAIMQFCPIDVAHRIAPCAMLWISVRDDPVVPHEQSERMYVAAREPRRLVTLSGKDHYGAYERHRRRILAESLAWLDAYLRPREVMVSP